MLYFFASDVRDASLKLAYMGIAYIPGTVMCHFSQKAYKSELQLLKKYFADLP